jgi:hypothetical protein
MCFISTRVITQLTAALLRKAEKFHVERKNKIMFINK